MHLVGLLLSAVTTAIQLSVLPAASVTVKVTLLSPKTGCCKTIWSY